MRKGLSVIFEKEGEPLSKTTLFLDTIFLILSGSIYDILRALKEFKSKRTSEYLNARVGTSQAWNMRGPNRPSFTTCRYERRQII